MSLAIELCGAAKFTIHTDSCLPLSGPFFKYLESLALLFVDPHIKFINYRITNDFCVENFLSRSAQATHVRECSRRQCCCHPQRYPYPSCRHSRRPFHPRCHRPRRDLHSFFYQLQRVASIGRARYFAGKLFRISYILNSGSVRS